jgi:hypothetical protein
MRLLQALLLGNHLRAPICCEDQLLLRSHVLTHVTPLEIPQLPQIYTPLLPDRGNPIWTVTLMYI